MNKQKVKELFGGRHINFKLRVFEQLTHEFLTSARITQKVNESRSRRTCILRKSVDSYLRVWASTKYVEKNRTWVRRPNGLSTYNTYQVRTYRRANEA